MWLCWRSISLRVSSGVRIYLFTDDGKPKDDDLKIKKCFGLIVKIWLDALIRRGLRQPYRAEMVDKEKSCNWGFHYTELIVKRAWFLRLISGEWHKWLDWRSLAVTGMQCGGWGLEDSVDGWSGCMDKPAQVGHPSSSPLPGGFQVRQESRCFQSVQWSADYNFFVEAFEGGEYSRR